jgi:NAD(P)-dependent dehydrogenase (short-subunit alcohol dehydrogenase family)
LSRFDGLKHPPGIGQKAAQELAVCGANLILTARDEKRGQKCAEELIELTGNARIEVVYMDYSDLESVRKAAARILREVGHLDIFLNCAAKGYCYPPVVTMDGHEEMY